MNFTGDNLSVQLFESLDPMQLSILMNDLAPNDLAIAAEVLGKSYNTEIVKNTLIPLLHHENSGVRESAIDGLKNHNTNAEVKLALRIVANKDKSLVIRLIARDTLG